MLIHGMGESQIEILCRKLKNKEGVEAKLTEPKVPYRETIRKTVEQQGKYKKQSGGHGQYGDVYIRFEPKPEVDFEFDDEIVGGVVPKQYIPAVEKGLRECITKGVLAGYPVVGMRAVLYFGSYHSVDSSELAFKMAASIAYKDGLPKANPVLLEPIMSISVTIPESYMGDIMGDLNKKEGQDFRHGNGERQNGSKRRSSARRNLQVRHRPSLHDAGQRKVQRKVRKVRGSAHEHSAKSNRRIQQGAEQRIKIRKAFYEEKGRFFRPLIFYQCISATLTICPTVTVLKPYWA